MRCYILYSTINKIRFKNKDTEALENEKNIPKELLHPSLFTENIQEKYNVKTVSFFFFFFAPSPERSAIRAEERIIIIIIIFLVCVNDFTENGECQRYQNSRKPKKYYWVYFKEQ